VRWYVIAIIDLHMESARFFSRIIVPCLAATVLVEFTYILLVISVNLLASDVGHYNVLKCQASTVIALGATGTGFRTWRPDKRVQ